MLKLKILISKFLQISFVGAVIRLIFRNRIPFYNSEILTHSKYITNGTVSRLFFKMYESAELRLVKKNLNPNLNVVEFGSSIGVMATQVGKISKSRIIALEANPDLIPIIENNLSHNKIQNYTVISNALSYGQDPIYFIRGNSNVSGSISSEYLPNAIPVEPITLNKIIEQYHIDKYALLCDIEGLEVALLLNDAKSFNNCEQIFIETHHTKYKGEVYTPESIKNIILNLGYELKESYGPCYYFERNNNKA